MGYRKFRRRDSLLSDDPRHALIKIPADPRTNLSQVGLGVTTDGAGNVYVADRGNDRVVKLVS
ncbi:hypothetical protein [Mycobacterium sp.]|uniref:hypothetical protein n=1 Tax=Mycobacterium sp. TaxID=1785 RepID=UPI003C76BB12